jgi:Tol biopolymer transport system component
MQPTRSLLRFVIRLAACQLALLAVLSLLALVVGGAIPSPLIALTRSGQQTPYAWYNRLHLMDTRSGLALNVSGQVVTCCAKWSPDGTRIAFTGLSASYVWDRRDGTVHTLAFPDDSSVVIDWTPDSESILISVSRPYQGNQLHRVDADGNGVSQVTFLNQSDPNADIYDVVWSPQGDFVVLAAMVGEQSQLFRVESDGRMVQQLTHNPGSGFDPRISPDGGRIAFLAELNENVELFVMNADGSQSRRLTRTPGDEGAPLWSPDGKRLLFQMYVNAHFPKALDVMNADGTGRKRLLDHTSHNHVPSWSPDGTQILYEVQGSEGASLYVMDADGSHPRFLAANLMALGLNASWQPGP